jgi:hypothetical protein
VPLRFVAEAFGAKVSWEEERRIVIIQDNEYVLDTKTLYSGDLVSARRAAIALPWKYTFLPLKPDPDYSVDVYQYTFWKGEALRYIYSDGKLNTYVEIKNGVAEVVWQGIDGILDGYSEEKGERPDFHNIVMFNKLNHQNVVEYGYASAPSNTWKRAEMHGYEDIIQEIPNETRTDVR